MKKSTITVCRYVIVLTLVMFGLAGDFFTFSASAGEIPPYPIKNITFIIPYSAGGTSDQVGRLIAQHLAEVLDINITCVNKAGSSGEIGTLELANSKADGSVIGTMCGPDFMVSDIVNDQFNFDSASGVEYIAMFNNTPLSYFATKGGKLDTWEKFTEYCKAHPGEVVVGEGGISHRVLAAAMMEHFDIKYTTVNFAGAADTVVALLGNHIDVASSGNQRAIDYISGGAVPILWSGNTKPEGFPNCPFFSDYGMDAGFIGVFNTVSTPKGVPDEVIKSLEAACAFIAKDPVFVDKLTKGLGYGYAPLVGREAVRNDIIAKIERIRAICEKYAELVISNG